MNTPVEFGLAIINSHPSGTGSFVYEGSFKIVVQNLAFNKQVSIWAQVGAVWKDIFASFAHVLPGNVELWIVPASNNEGQFVAKYTVNGTTHWDNNNGTNYKFPRVVDVPVGSVTQIQFAAFYRVPGTEFWDNNFTRNYTITPTVSHQWGH